MSFSTLRRMLKKLHRHYIEHVGFALVEMIITISVIGAIASIVLTAVGPRTIILKSLDTKRDYYSKEVRTAFVNYVTDKGTYPNATSIPVGAENARPICKQGMRRDTSCYSLDFLLAEFAPSLERDDVEPCSSYSGYKIYKEHSEIFVVPAYIGKLKGDPVQRTCPRDTIAPDIQLKDPPVDFLGGIVRAHFTTDEPATERVRYSKSTTTVDCSHLLTGEGCTSFTETTASDHNPQLLGLDDLVHYYYWIDASDPDGNLWTVGPFTFDTPDLNAPIFLTDISQAANPITYRSELFTWSTNESSTSQVLYAGRSDFLDTDADVVTTPLQDPNPAQSEGRGHSVTVEGFTASTDYWFRVKSRDASGNEGTSGTFSFRTDPDTIGPVISAVNAMSLDGVTATVTWTTKSEIGEDDPADSQVEYWLGSGTHSLTSVTDSPPTQSRVVNHTVPLSGLTPNQQYHYRVIAKDEFGNSSTSTEKTFTTTDSTSPVISNVAAPPATIGKTFARVTWTTDENAKSRVFYSLTSPVSRVMPPAAGTDLTTLDESLATLHSVDVTGLQPDRTYYYHVWSRDEASNEVRSGPPDVSFQTRPAVEFSVVNDANRTSIGFTVTWNTDVVADGKLEVGTATGSYNPAWTRMDTRLLQNGHLAYVQGLSPSTTYFYRLTSTDVGGNAVVYYPRLPVVTPADVTAPLIIDPYNAVVNATGTRADIRWLTDELANALVDYRLEGTTPYIWQKSELGSYAIDRTLGLTAGIAPGNSYRFRITSADQSGNPRSTPMYPSASERKFDTIPPLITSVPPVTVNPITGNAATFSWTTNESATARVGIGTSGPSDVSYLTAYGSSGLSHSALTSAAFPPRALQPNTLYYYTVTSEDTYKNKTTYQGSFTTPADTTGPTITLAPPVVWRSGCSGGGICADVPWTTNEVADEQVFWRVDAAGPPWTAVPSSGPAYTSPNMRTPHKQRILGLADSRTYYYQVTSRDAAGFPTTRAGPFFETTPPTVVSGPTVTVLTSTTARVTWTANEYLYPLYQVRVRIGAGSWVSKPFTSTTRSGDGRTITINFRDLAANTIYSYQVIMDDRYRNQTVYTSSDLFSTDLTAPTLVGSVSATPEGSDMRITWTTNEAASTRVEYGLSPAYGNANPPAAQPPADDGNLASAANMVTNHSILIPGPLIANQQYNFHILSKDAAGNLLSTANQQFTIVDVTAPSISNLRHASVGDTTATILWDTNESASSQVEYSTSSSFSTYNSTTLADTSPRVTAHTFDLSGLAKGTTYYYRAKSRDAASNLQTSPQSGPYPSFSTMNTTPPTISNPTTNAITWNGATVAWATDELSDSTVEYWLTNDGGTIVTAVSPGQFSTNPPHTVTLQNLAPNTSYTFRVKSSNGIPGVPTATAGDFSFTTLHDSSYPVISNITVVPTDNGATITWTTDKMTTGQVEYGDTSYAGAGGPTVLNPVTATVTAHTGQYSHVLTGLTPNTTYHFRILSTDGGGNTSFSVDKIFSTPDTNGPVISAVSERTLAPTSARVTWTTNEISNSQVEWGLTTSYGEFTNLSAANVIPHSVDVTVPVANTNYHYRVLSRDPSGNLTLSNDYILDLTLPIIDPLSISSGAPNTTTATIVWTTNELSDSTVEYWVSGAPGVVTTVNVASLVSGSPPHSVPLTGLANGTRYYYRVKSTDAVGNQAVSGEKYFDTLNAAPTFTTPPAVSYPGDGTVRITWSTDESADGTVVWGLSNGTYTDGSASDPITTGLTHTVILSGLPSGTQVWYQARSSDGLLTGDSGNGSSFIAP